MIRFGPAGLGGVKDAISNLENYAKLELKACEIAFTYSIYIKPEQTKPIKQAAEKLGIKLSIHSPYWMNLNSKDKDKKEKSKQRILKCCELGELLGVEKVIFHPGYYGKMNKDETFENIKKAIIELQDKIKEKKWKVKLVAETAGKINVFGSVDEILRLVKETGCLFCIDFAHVYARNKGKIDYKEVYDKFKEFPSLHCHFSGIKYGEKGEKSHELTNEAELKKLLSVLPRNKDITIINESPEPIGYSVKGLKTSKTLGF